MPFRGYLVLALLAAAASAAPPAEPVDLGDPSLTAGIPGEGPLTAVQIEAWLADERNHTPLRPRLPLGLAAGAVNTSGLDDNPLTRAKIELGRQLYFDKRLSSDATISCASCHAPSHGYAFNTRFGVGVDDQEGARNSPTAVNRIVSAAQFWDGRAESLEEQAVGPIENPIEMGNTHEACAACLHGVQGYRTQFERVFADGLTIDNVGRAIASFERVIVTGPSPWDYHEQLAKFEKAYAEDLEDIEYLQEEDPELLEEWDELKAAAAASPMSESAVRGAELFFSQRVGCTQCHVGANFADEKYHNLGVGMERAPSLGNEGELDPDSDEVDRLEIDWGRYTITGDDADRGAFKTPTLRNVAQTPPYMHDGSQKTLLEVVEWYDKGGHKNPWLSDKVKQLKLTDQEKAELVAFMEALTGELPVVEEGRLPE